MTTPTPVELLFGHNRIHFSASVNKPIAGKWRYDLLGSAVSDYKNTRSETEVVINNSFVYRFHGCCGVSGGVQYHYLKGFVPNFAFHGSYANPVWLLLFTPTLGMLPTQNLSVGAIAEFKPVLSTRTRLYTRAQLFYEHNITNNRHARSHCYFRLGLLVGKWAFGAGANLDYYGSNRLLKDNLGGFLRISI